MKFEVEHRGILSKEKFNEIKSFLDKEAEFIEEKDRFSIIYILSKDDKRKNDLIDLKLRITNKKPELTLKYGKYGGKDARKEFSFNIDYDKFDEMVEFLKVLGFSEGVFNATKTFVYLYKDIEFSLVEVPNWGYYFEAEILVDNNAKEADLKIEKECKKLGLNVVDEKEFDKLLNDLNSREGYGFDFNKEGYLSVKKRFIDYF